MRTSILMQLGRMLPCQRAKPKDSFCISNNKNLWNSIKIRKCRIVNSKLFLILLIIDCLIRNSNENEMSHFFRSLPFQPYSYNLYPDGQAVGKYTPKNEFIWTRPMQVTKEKFLDTRIPENRTDPRPKNIVHPECT